MNLSRLFTPVALAAVTAFGLGAPAEAQAAQVSVKIAPVKVGVKIGPVTVSGVLGKKTPAPAPSVRHHRPSPHAIWVAAHQTYDVHTHRMVHVAAGWKTPPRAGMQWVEGHWTGHGHSRRWTAGHWR